MKLTKKQLQAIHAKRQGFTLQDFRKNEDVNNHTENTLALVEKFGDAEDLEKIYEIAKRHQYPHGISQQDYKNRYILHKKYYPKLIQEKRENDDKKSYDLMMKKKGAIDINELQKIGNVVSDPYFKQKQKSNEMRKAVSNGKISKTDYYSYYYSIPYRLREQYGVPKIAPRL